MNTNQTSHVIFVSLLFLAVGVALLYFGSTMIIRKDDPKITKADVSPEVGGSIMIVFGIIAVYAAFFGKPLKSNWW